MSNAAKTALIVGGTSGLGLAVARRLKTFGWSVIVSARKPGNGEFHFYECDVTSESSRLALWEKFPPAHPRGPALEALIITAGGFTGDIKATNYDGPVRLARDFLAVLKGGSVTFVSSTEVGGKSEYGEAKRTLEWSVENLAKTFYGVRFNAVRPCAIRGGHAAPLPEDGRPIVDVEDVADAVCFLVRNKAMNGVVLPVGGEA